MRSTPAQQRPFRLRTITAGARLESPVDRATLRASMDFLDKAQRQFEENGYEVQMARIASQPAAEYLAGLSGAEALEALCELDLTVAEGGVLLSVGPVNTGSAPDELAPWVAEVVAATSHLSASVEVASSSRGVDLEACRTAAEVMARIAGATSGGEGNFRFAAAANIQPGTPFFPVAYHDGEEAFSIGLESAGLVKIAFTDAADLSDAKERLRALLEAELAPVEALGHEIARREDWRYLGIDVSPAPGLDDSIAEAIELLSGVAFGGASTLTVCAAITEVLQRLPVTTCGYSGLMLPVLEDRVLAQRAGENRYGVEELLLFSSVCGTGLDVVPLAGDTPVDAVAALIGDVATLSSKLGKPLSARLFLVPGKSAGDLVSFENPHLTDCVVMGLD
ncbi:MAG: DUF711 family protein [Thermoanaerobaculia bacterium]